MDNNINIAKKTEYISDKAKQLCLLALITFSLVFSIIFIGFLTWHNSPEYALKITAEDLQNEGIAGLEKHLSSRALDEYNALSRKFNEDHPIMGSIISEVYDKYAGKITSDISIKSCEVVNKHLHDAEAIVAIDYQGVNFTITIEMLREDGQWVIDDIGLPSASSQASSIFGSIIHQ